MRAVDFINTRVEELLERYKKEDFDIAQALMIEAGYKEDKDQGGKFSSSFFSFLCERLYIVALEKGMVINNLYLIKHLPRKEYAYIDKTGTGEGENYKEIFPGIIVYKDVLYKILDKLNLTKSKEVYTNYIIINEKELTESKGYLLNYFSKEQIKKFKSLEIFNETLKKEYEEKLHNKKRLIVI